MKALALALLLLAGCEACAPPPPVYVAPHPIPGRVVLRVEPGTALRLVWADVGHCAGRIEPIDGWTFYVVLGGPWPSSDPHWDYLAATWPGLRRIYVADTMARDLKLLRHEILHAHGLDHAPVFVTCGAYPWPSEIWRGQP